jgi:predicted nucleic acid-binding protein
VNGPWLTFRMIVLVDTSVWIRFLSNRALYAAELDRLSSRDEVSGHQFVYGELLIGDVGGRKQLLKDYQQMHQAPVVAHDDVVAVVQ